MPVSTAPAAPATALGLPVLLKQLENELNLAFFERRDQIQAILITLLAAENGFILGPPGCLAGDTMINVNRASNGTRLRLDELVARFNGDPVTTRGWDLNIPTMVQRAENGFVRLGQLKGAWESGVKETFLLVTRSGRRIRATDEHPFLTADGEWAKLGELRVGDFVQTREPVAATGRAPKTQYRSRYTRFHPSQKPTRDGFRHLEHRLVVEAHLNGLDFTTFLKALREDEVRCKEFVFLPSDLVVHHRDHNPFNNTLDNLAVITQSAHALDHADEDTRNRVLAKTAGDRIIMIEKFGEEMTYDLSVADDPHNFLANDFVVHNTAKSELLETICSSFVGAKYWRILLDRQMGKEDSVGAIDITKYLAGGGWGRDVTDTFADAHVALLDEAGNTGPAVMNAFLTIMNEKQFKPNGHWISVPLISAFGASNYWLEDMPAMWDRFMVRFTVDYIVEDNNFASLYDRAAGQLVVPHITTHIALTDLQQAITVDVPAVIIPPGVRDSVRQLRSDLRAEQIVISDRRWAKTARLIKAAAFLNGRDRAEEDDLAVLQHVLYEAPEHATLVRRKVLSMTSPTTRAAMEFASELDSLSAEVDARRGQAVEDRAAFGGQAHFQMGDIQNKLGKAIELAHRKGRATVALDAVNEQIKALRTKVYVECMNMDPDRAATML